jgi:hypothetical protein
MLRAGEGPEAIIGQLAADKEQYLKRIMELESIAPRKVVLPDGRVMIWQCPLELVPPMNTPNAPALPRRDGGAE